MADPHVLVAGTVLRRRSFDTTTVPGCVLAAPSGGGLAGGGAIAAVTVAAMRADLGVTVRLVAQVGDDPAGARCREWLARQGVAVDGVAVVGETGELLVLDPPSGDPQQVLVPGERGSSVCAFEAELARCAPGDVLLVDGLLLATPETRWIVEAAYQADLQVVVDLHPPVTEALADDVVSRADVVVTDAEGAGIAADRGVPPDALAVHDGALGSWWGDLSHGPVGADRDAGPRGDAVHRLAGALAACLASGMDRPEAFEVAVPVAGRAPVTIGG